MHGPAPGFTRICASSICSLLFQCRACAGSEISLIRHVRWINLNINESNFSTAWCRSFVKNLEQCLQALGKAANRPKPAEHMLCMYNQVGHLVGLFERWQFSCLTGLAVSAVAPDVAIRQEFFL